MPFTGFATIVSYLIAALQLAWGMTPEVDWVLFGARVQSAGRSRAQRDVVRSAQRRAWHLQIDTNRQPTNPACMSLASPGEVKPLEE